MDPRKLADYERRLDAVMKKNLEPRSLGLPCLCVKCKEATRQSTRHMGFKSIYEGKRLCPTCEDSEQRAGHIERMEKYRE